MSTDPESHEFEVERVIAADPEAVFDGFVEIYDRDDRPDWILSSEMDLRVGGEWTVELEPAEMEAFTETRIIAELDRPKRLAYSMTTRGADCIAFGGFKQSGIGREGGVEGLHPFLETKTVILEGRPGRYGDHAT